MTTQLAANRRCVAAARMVLRSGGGSPSRSCDLRSEGAIAIPDAGIDRYFSVGMGLAES